MTRLFTDINFRRDFSRRMTANEHDESFDAFVRELRRSSEAVALDAGHSIITLPQVSGSPLPNQYTVGTWNESWLSTVIGLPGAAASSHVVTKRFSGNHSDCVQLATRGGVTPRSYVRAGTSATTWGPWSLLTQDVDAASYAAPGIGQLITQADLVASANLGRLVAGAELRSFAGPKFINPVQHGTTNVFDNWLTFPGQAGFTKARAVIGYFEFTDTSGGTGMNDAFTRADPTSVQYQISAHRSGDSSANAHGNIFVVPCADDDGSFQFMVQGGHVYNIRAHGYFF